MSTPNTSEQASAPVLSHEPASEKSEMARFIQQVSPTKSSVHEPNPTEKALHSSDDDNSEPTPKRSRRNSDGTLLKSKRKPPIMSERHVCVVPHDTMKVPNAVKLNQLCDQGLGLTREKIVLTCNMTKDELIALIQLQFEEIDFTGCRFARGHRSRRLEVEEDLSRLLNGLSCGTKLYVVLAADQQTPVVRSITPMCVITPGPVLQTDTLDNSSCDTANLGESSTSWAPVFKDEFEQSAEENETLLSDGEVRPFVQRFTNYLENLSPELFEIELSKTVQKLKDSFFCKTPLTSYCTTLCPVFRSNYSRTMTPFFSRLSTTERVIKVKFIGNSISDLASQRREALSGYLKEIVDQYFVGDDGNKIIVQKPELVVDGSYVAIGKAIGHALLLEKICLNTLAVAQVCFLVGGMEAASALSFKNLCHAVNDSMLKKSLTKFYNDQANTSDEVVLTSEMAKRGLFGHLTKESCKQLAFEYVITSRLGALLGLKQGLDFYGLTETMKSKMELAASLTSIVVLTPEIFYEMLDPRYSFEGSDRKELETQVIAALYLVLINADNGVAPFSLKDLLMFATGNETLPEEKISIHLEFSDPDRLPEARTREPLLILPMITDEDELQNKIALAITN